MTRHRSLIATGIALTALGLAALPSPAATKARTVRKVLPGELESLTMDGARVAYDVKAGGTAGSCNKLSVWNVRTGALTRMSGAVTCAADTTSTGAGVRELALAGNRLAWTVNLGGNSESADYLFTATLFRPKEHRLAFARRTGDAGGVLAGNWIGGLVGSGTFIGVNEWVTNQQGRIASGALRAIRSGLRTVATGTETVEASSTDGRQIAVLGRDEAVRVYSTAGALRRTIRPPSPTEVALRGDYLGVLTTADTLQVYNSHSGRRLHTWRVAHGARSLDVSNGYAAYAAPFPSGGYARVVHVRRLTGGRDRVLVITPPELAAVQLEPTGLVYAYNTIGAGRHGTVQFLPLGRVVRAVRAR